MKSPTTADFSFVKKRYRPVPPTAHKGTQGHVVLIGGSYGKTGAVIMATQAAIHSGCGLATAFLPKCGYLPMQVAVPEAMVVTDKRETEISAIHFDIHPSAVAIGMGMGQHENTATAFSHFLQTVKVPLLIDADALNLLAKDKALLQSLPPKTILTPHQKELERLIGEWKDEEEKLALAVQFSIAHQLIIVLKGAPTLIVDGTQIYRNTTGNAALATGGSGDVLSGIICSLLAQQYPPIDAALLGVYIHGLTADIALPEVGTHAFTATTIIAYLGKAFLSFENVAKSAL